MDASCQENVWKLFSQVEWVAILMTVTISEETLWPVFDAAFAYAEGVLPNSLG